LLEIITHILIYKLGSTNGNNLGIATTANSFTNGANVNDMVLRSINRLLLVSGQTGYGIMIDANNYVYVNKLLSLNIDNVERSVIENRIFTNGAMLTGVFAGDTILTGYWGVAINLNYGGFTNGVGGGNNSRSYVAGYSAFTINMRSSTSQTTFDRRLFTVMPDGNTTINGTLTATAITLTSSTTAVYANNASASSIFLGTIGIGLLFPAAKLHVASGSTSTGNIYQRYLSIIIGDGTNTQTLTDVCAIFDSSVWCKSKFTTSSDIRIKNNIKDIDDDTALQKILQIQPKTYEYIDKVERGNDIVYGFIAQQIKEVIPEAVKIEKAVIPNIFKICNYNNDIITLPEEDINKLKIDDEIEIIINDDNNKRSCKIIEINNDNTIKINESLNITTEETETIKECFVYGSKVDDFHTLDKTYIFTLNVCATQELYKLIQQQNIIIQDLQNRISILENNNNIN
jgi:hypothetical protein